MLAFVPVCNCTSSHFGEAQVHQGQSIIGAHAARAAGRPESRDPPVARRRPAPGLEYYMYTQSRPETPTGPLLRIIPKVLIMFELFAVLPWMRIGAAACLFTCGCRCAMFAFFLSSYSREYNTDHRSGFDTSCRSSGTSLRRSFPDFLRPSSLMRTVASAIDYPRRSLIDSRVPLPTTFKSLNRCGRHERATALAQIELG